jgi:hypothetical protein
MGNSLYEITNALQVLQEKDIDEMSEEEKIELQKGLEELLLKKSGSVIQFMQNIQSNIDALKSEEQRLKSVRQYLENRQEKFQDYVMNCMNKIEAKEIITDSGILKIRNNPLSVEILDEDLIPNKFKKQIVETKVDKNAIKDEFKKTGEVLDGVRYVTDKKSLNIK